MKKKVFLGLITLTGLALYGVVIGQSSNVFQNVFEMRSAYGTNDYNLTFSRSSGTTTQTGLKTVTSATTSRGNTYYLVNQSSVSWDASTYPGSNYIANMAKNDIVYFTNSPSGTSDFCFQGVKSISIVLNTTYSKQIYIQTSLDAQTWTDNSFYVSSSTPTYTFASDAHYIRLKWMLDMSQYIKSVGLNYGCTDGYIETITSLKVINPKTSYGVGDSFVEPEVHAVYNTGVEAKVTGATFTGFDSSVACDSQTITVSYQGVSTQYNIEIKAGFDELIGTFTHSYFSLTFNSGNTGFQTYGSSTCQFTWTHVGSLITLNYVSGTLDDFGNYRLFSSTTTPNTTPSLNGDTLSLKTYNMFSSATSRTLTRQ